MPADLAFPLPVLYGFLLVLARVSGIFAFVPLPGLASGPRPARVVLSVMMALVLYPRWPHPEPSAANAGSMLMWVLPEAAVGVAIGLGVAFILDVFVICAQILSLNAGYSFASVVDPTTQAESGVLVVLAQLAGGLMFFALGLDREVVRVLAYSLEMHPAGVLITPPAAEALLHLGGDMLALAVRLALPAIALLILGDLALGLVGRLNPQLQLLTLGFPIKMMSALVLLIWIAGLVPKLLTAYAGAVFAALRHALRF
jgi:flagellar biosynthesis protein FliR